MLEAIIALITASTLLLGSPGPAPLALAATGATYGVKGGIPFLSGILLGLFTAILVTAIGLGTLFTSLPTAIFIVKIFGGLYILYLAVKIVLAPVILSDDIRTLNMQGLIDGFLINLLNPKAYVSLMAIFSQFMLPITNKLLALALTGFTCLLVGAAVDIAWLCFGGVIGPIFKKPKQSRLIRIIFAILMVLAVLWALLR